MDKIQLKLALFALGTLQDFLKSLFDFNHTQINLKTLFRANFNFFYVHFPGYALKPAPKTISFAVFA